MNLGLAIGVKLDTSFEVAQLIPRLGRVVTLSICLLSASSFFISRSSSLNTICHICKMRQCVCQYAPGVSD